MVYKIIKYTDAYKLHTGWSNPPKISSATFYDTNITLTWDPPEYTGGETIQYYKVVFQSVLAG